MSMSHRYGSVCVLVTLEEQVIYSPAVQPPDHALKFNPVTGVGVNVGVDVEVGEDVGVDVSSNCNSEFDLDAS